MVYDEINIIYTSLGQNKMALYPFDFSSALFFKHPSDFLRTLLPSQVFSCFFGSKLLGLSLGPCILVGQRYKAQLEITLPLDRKCQCVHDCMKHSWCIISLSISFCYIDSHFGIVFHLFHYKFIYHKQSIIML